MFDLFTDDVLQSVDRSHGKDSGHPREQQAFEAVEEVPEDDDDTYLRSQELNTEHAQIRTLLDRQREQILADCQAEIRRHEFQANYDRRSIQKLSEMIESQQEELHRAQAEERHRRDQKLLHGQLLKQNWDLREAHEKSLKEMEELKKFQSSTFDTIARRRLVEDQDTILELTGNVVKERTSLVSTPSLAELYRFAMNFLLVRKRKRKRKGTAGREGSRERRSR